MSSEEVMVPKTLELSVDDKKNEMISYINMCMRLLLFSHHHTESKGAMRVIYEVMEEYQPFF
jgi:hypothetical protein